MCRLALRENDQCLQHVPPLYKFDVTDAANFDANVCAPALAIYRHYVYDEPMQEGFENTEFTSY